MVVYELKRPNPSVPDKMLSTYSMDTNIHTCASGTT